MANWFTQLFSKSPFGTVVEHQHTVQRCVEQVPELVDACLRGDQPQVREQAKKISQLEHEADQLKTQVRDTLPATLFMPVSRGDVLKVLSSQDSIADCAEDLGVLLTLREMEPPPEEVARLLRELVAASVAVVSRSTAIVEELDRLANTSFSGPRAKQVLNAIDELDRQEHAADKIQDQLGKAFFRHEDDFKPAATFMWMKIFNRVGDLANFAEKMTHQIRLFLADSRS